jgi:crossover junction endodeoxyribonuclease RuvC
VADRVHEVGKNVHEIIGELRPQILIIEQSFSLPKNPKSSLLMSHVRGAVLYVAVEHGLKIIHYAATRIKKTLTGGGHASKEDIQEAVKRELKIDLAKVPHDVADAVAIALCHYYAPIVEEQPAA